MQGLHIKIKKILTEFGDSSQKMSGDLRCGLKIFTKNTMKITVSRK